MVNGFSNSVFVTKHINYLYTLQTDRVHKTLYMKSMTILHLICYFEILIFCDDIII